MKQKTKGYIVAVISILFSAFLIVLALALSNLAKGDIRERSQDVEDYRKWSVQEKYTKRMGQTYESDLSFLPAG